MNGRGLIFFSILLFLPVSGCASGTAQTDIPQSPVIAGGWNRVDPTGPDIREDALFAIATGTGKLAEVELAETQVVAGINVRMIVRLADGRRERVTVWRRLDGTRQLTDVEPLPGG